MPKGERSGALPFPLNSFGSRSRSQTNEDGIIACIFDRIAPLRRDFVEFGIGPNLERSITTRKVWRGIAFY